MALPLSRLYSAVFPQFESSPDTRPSPAARAGADDVRIRWLGTAGFVVQTAKTTLMIDPYLTRSPVLRLVAPLVPDEQAVRAELPERVDAVLCGHSHFDHLLDAPLIARITGAKLLGSETTCAFGRAGGLSPEQLICIEERDAAVAIGDVEVRFVPSLHARLFFGRVPFSGKVSRPPQLPVRAWRYRMGGAFGIFVRAGGVSIYHNGSADLVDARLEGEHADVLLIGVAGWQKTPSYIPRLMGLLRPKVVIPAHHDAFFAPLRAGLRLLPGVDLAGFVTEAKRAAPKASVVLPVYDEVLSIAPLGDGIAAIS